MDNRKCKNCKYGDFQNESKGVLHVVNFSGGKDSTAMLLHMLELGMPIDEVVNVDTGMEFPAMYRHIEKVRAVVETAGVKFTTLKADKTFEFYLTEVQVNRRNHKFVGVQGYGWPGPRMRWCTSSLKTRVMKAHLKALKAERDVVEYVGLAADEMERAERKNNENLIAPLIQWGWTEDDALRYCYDHGYDWEGLYKLFKRVSCWCCPLQSLQELRQLRRHFPDLWERLFELDSRQYRRNFNASNTLAQLEARFALEDERTEQGLTINARSKEFKDALAERLKKE